MSQQSASSGRCTLFRAGKQVHGYALRRAHPRSAAASAELINGRLAMLGIVFSAMEEAKTGLTVSEQAQQLNVPMFILLGSIAYASLVPIMKGAKTEAFGERRVLGCLGIMPCGSALAS